MKDYSKQSQDEMYSSKKLPKLTKNYSSNQTNSKKSQKSLLNLQQPSFKRLEMQISNQQLKFEQKDSIKQKSLFKKYQSMSETMNNQLSLQKAIFSKSNSSSLLKTYGGKMYRSQSKSLQDNKNNYDDKSGSNLQGKSQSSKVNKSKNKEQKVPNNNSSSLLTSFKQHSATRQLRKRTKHQTGVSFTSTQVRKQLSVNKVFYENPVKKIGFNMQFEAKLRFQHLQQLQQFKQLVEEIESDNYVKQSAIVTIVYFIKDCQFRPNIITERNTQTPICVAIVAEYFNSKLSKSNKIRNFYLQKMKSLMNNTYDPQVMSRWPRITDFPTFNHDRYNRLLKRFNDKRQSSYNPKWAQHIFKLINYPLSPQQTAVFLRQIWQLFNKSNAMINLDYVLKDPFYIKKFSVSPYLGTRHVTSKKIVYHGGYSKQLYPEWCSYVKSGRKSLMGRLKKYNIITQSVWRWVQYFQHLTLFQTDFIKTLNRPLSLKTFKKLQQKKINQMQFYLQHTWMRGIMMVFYHKMYLQTEQGEYDNLQEKLSQMMKQYVLQLNGQINSQSSTKKDKHYLHLVEEKVYQAYCNIWKQFRLSTKRSVRSQCQFLPIFSGQQKQKREKRLLQSQSSNLAQQVQLHELRTLLNIHFSSIIQQSLSQLQELIIYKENKKTFSKTKKLPLLYSSSLYSKNNSKKPIIRLTLIVDRQNIRLRQKQQDVIELFGQLVKEIFGIEIQSFGVGFDWTQTEMGDGYGYRYGGSGDRRRKATRFFDDKPKDDVKIDNNDDKVKIQDYQQMLTQQKSQKTSSAQVDIEANNDNHPNKHKKHQYQSRKQHKQSSTNSFISSYPEITKTPFLKNNQLSIHYRYAHNHQQQLTQLFSYIHNYYNESLKILQLFTPYLPFIKLTTSKYIFHQHEDIGRNLQDVFVKNLKIINEYKQKLTKINKSYNIKMFQINCQQPIRQLTQRINQVQYLTQQKFMNKLFDNVHQIEKRLILIKNHLHTYQVKLTNLQDVENTIKKYQLQIAKINQQVRNLQKKIAFFFSLGKIQSTLVIRYQQLVTKKIEVIKQLKAFKQYVHQTKPQLQSKIIIQAEQISLELQQLMTELNKIEQTYVIDIKSIQKMLISKLNLFEQKLLLYEIRIKEYKQSAYYVLPTGDINQKVDMFNQIMKRFVNVNTFWTGVERFYQYLNTKLSTKVCELQISQYVQVINSAKQIISSHQKQLTQRIKRIKNNSQIKIVEEFVQIVSKCEQMKMMVGILSNKKVMDRHWIRFGLQDLKNVRLKDVLNVLQNECTQRVNEDDNNLKQQEQRQSEGPSEQEQHLRMSSASGNQNQLKTPQIIESNTETTPNILSTNLASLMNKLTQLNRTAENEHNILALYQSIRQKLKINKLRIIDVNGSDVLDVRFCMTVLQVLYNSKIQLQMVLERNKQSCQFMLAQLTNLLTTINLSYQRLTVWRQIQHHYIKLSSYYVQNQQFTTVEAYIKYQQIKQLHRKLIKTFDINDSIYYVGENVGLRVYSQEINKRLPDLLSILNSQLHQIRLKHPRLCLLNHQQLLQLLSTNPNLQKLIKKCFPFLKQIDIKQGAIQRVGEKRHLKFIQGITVGQRVGAIKEWMGMFEERMKSTLREIYRKGSAIVNSGKSDSMSMGNTGFNYAINNNNINLAKSKQISGQSYKSKSFSPLTTNFLPHTSITSQNINYPLQLIIIDEYIWFTNITQQSIVNNQLNKLFQIICEKILSAIKANSDVTIVLLYILFREIVSKLVDENVLDLQDYAWLKQPHAYLHTIPSTSSLSSLTTTPQIQPQIVIMSQIYQYGWTYHQQPQIFFSPQKNKISFYGNALIGHKNSGKKSLCKYYGQLTANQIFVVNYSQEGNYFLEENKIQKLINYVKLACHTGAWLFIQCTQEDNNNVYGYQQMCVVASCMEAINKAIRQKSSKLNLFGQSLPLYYHPQIFLSLQSLNPAGHSRIPSLLVQSIRPIFITRPDPFYILKLYLQSRSFQSEKTLQWIRFITELQHHQKYLEVIIEWIKRQPSNSDEFKVNNLLMKLVRNGYSQKLVELIQSQSTINDNGQFHQQSLMKQLQNEITFTNYDGLIIYGRENIGKTYQLKKVLQKYPYLYIDMNLYQQKLKSTHTIITQFQSLSPSPQFLLIKDGIEYYKTLIPLKQKNVRLIFIQTQMKYIHVSVLYNVKVINFERLVQTQIQSVVLKDNQIQNDRQCKIDPLEYVLCEILGRQVYLRLFVSQNNQSVLIQQIESKIQRFILSSNIKITFAKLYRTTLQNYANKQMAFIFSVIWSYGQFIQQSKLVNIIDGKYCCQDVQSRNIKSNTNKIKNNKVQIKNNKVQIVMRELISEIKCWLRQGKILSLMDLRLTKSQNSVKFENNFNITSRHQIISPLHINDKVCLQLGMLCNISLIHKLNSQQSIKIQTKSWLTTILQSVQFKTNISKSVEFKQVTDNHQLKQVRDNVDNGCMIIRQAHKLIFKQLVNIILYRVKRNKNKFIFQPNIRIIIDDVHLMTSQNYTLLQHLSTQKQIFYIDQIHKNIHSHLHQYTHSKRQIYTHQKRQKQVNHFISPLNYLIIKNCSFTLGTKINLTYPMREKSIVVKLRQHHTQSIFYQFIRVYLSTQHFVIDMSVAQLLMISQQITKRYEQKLSTTSIIGNDVYNNNNNSHGDSQIPFYFKHSLFSNNSQQDFNNRRVLIRKQLFWFRNPLLMSLKIQNRKEKKVSEVYYSYLRTVCDMLPQQQGKKLVNLHHSLIQRQRSEMIGFQTVFGILRGQQYKANLDDKNTIKVASLNKQQSQNQQESAISQTKVIPCVQSPLVSNLIINNKTLKQQQIISLFNKQLRRKQEQHTAQRHQQQLKQELKIELLKIYRQLKQNHNLILLGDVYTERQHMCKLACKMLNYPLVEFHQQKLLKRLIALDISNNNEGNNNESNNNEDNNNECNIDQNINGQGSKIVVLIKSSDISSHIIQKLIKTITQEDLTCWQQKHQQKDQQQQQHLYISNKRQEQQQQTQTQNKINSLDLNQLYKKIKFVIKLNHTQLQSTNLYSLYPQLGCLFVTIKFQSIRQSLSLHKQHKLTVQAQQKHLQKQSITQHKQLQLQQQQQFLLLPTIKQNQLKQDINKLAQWQQDINKLAQKHSISKQFLIQFPSLLQENTQSQYQKLQYYRKITSQMVINIDRLTKYNKQQIPQKIQSIAQNCSQINQKKIAIKRNIDKLSVQVQQNTTKTKETQLLLQKTIDNQHSISEKLQKIISLTNIKMQKIQKKIDAIDASEFLKLKYLNKNDIAIGLTIGLFNFININKIFRNNNLEQKEKQRQSSLMNNKNQSSMSSVLSHPFTKLSLINSLKQIRHQFNSIIPFDSQRMCMLEQNSLTHIKVKIEEIKGLGVKKYEKLGVIWKYLYQWLTIDEEGWQVLEEYVEKGREITVKLSQLNLVQMMPQYKTLTKEQTQNKITDIKQKDHKESQGNQTQVMQSLQVSQVKPIVKFKKIQIQSQPDNTQQQQQIESNKQQQKQQQKSIKQVNSLSYLLTQKHVRQLINSLSSQSKQLSISISKLQQQRRQLTMNQSQLIKYKQFLQQKRINLTRILENLSSNEYMKRISSNIAQYFRDIPKISFNKTLQQLKYNEFSDDSLITNYKLPLQHNYNIFSSDESIRVFKQKYHLYNKLTQQEIESLYNVVNNNKQIVVVEDEEGVIIEELTYICGQSLGFQVVQVDGENKNWHGNISTLQNQHILGLHSGINDSSINSNTKEQQLKQLIMKKLRNYNNLLVIIQNSQQQQQQQYNTIKNNINGVNNNNITLINNNNITSINNNNTTNQQVLFSTLYKQFFQVNKNQSQSLQQQKKKLILVYDHKQNIKTEYFQTISVGRILLGYQRWVEDFIQAMAIGKNANKKTDNNNSNSNSNSNNNNSHNHSNNSNKLTYKHLQTTYPHIAALIIPSPKLLSIQQTQQQQQQYQYQQQQHQKQQEQQQQLDINLLQQEQLEQLINYSNTRMKQNLKNISTLTQITTDNNNQLQQNKYKLQLTREQKLTREQITQSLQSQNNIIQEIQNNLEQINLINQIINSNLKHSNKYKQLNVKQKQSIDNFVLGFFILYQYINHNLNNTDSPLFGTKTMYNDWLKVLKQIKLKTSHEILSISNKIRGQQKYQQYSKIDHKSIDKPQHITIQHSQGIRNSSSVRNSESVRNSQSIRNSQGIRNSQIIRNSQQQKERAVQLLVVKEVLVKLCQQIKWLRKQQLYQFLFIGIVIIQLTKLSLKFKYQYQRIVQLRELLVKWVRSNSNNNYQSNNDKVISRIEKILLQTSIQSKSHSHSQNKLKEKQKIIWQTYRYQLTTNIIELLKLFIHSQHHKQRQQIISLIEALHSRSHKLLEEPEIIMIYHSLSKDNLIYQLLKQTLTKKYDFHLIKKLTIQEMLNHKQKQSEKSYINKERNVKAVSQLIPLRVLLDVKQSQLTTPITIIQDNEQAIPQILSALKYRAKYYKRQFLSMVYLQHQPQKVTQKIKQIYQKGKTWLYWINIGHSAKCSEHVRHLLHETTKYPTNKYVRMFILLPKIVINYNNNNNKAKKQQHNTLRYDKYAISKIVGSTQLRFEQLVDFIMEIIKRRGDLLNSNNETKGIMNKQSIKTRNNLRQKKQASPLSSSLAILNEKLYQLLIISYGILSQKHFLYNKSQSIWHFISYLSQFQSIYPLNTNQTHSMNTNQRHSMNTNQRDPLNTNQRDPLQSMYRNSMKYIIEKFSFVDEEYDQLKVKDQIDVCEKLIKEGLEWRGLENAIGQSYYKGNDEQNKRQQLIKQLQHLQHVQINQISPPLKLKQNRTKQSSITTNPTLIHSTLYKLALQSLSRVNQINFKNSWVNYLIKQIQSTHKLTALNMYDKNYQLIYGILKNILKAINQQCKDLIQINLNCYSMVINYISYSKPSIQQKKMYKVESTNLLYDLFNRFKYQIANHHDTNQSIQPKYKKKQQQLKPISKTSIKKYQNNPKLKDNKLNNNTNSKVKYNFLQKLIKAHYLIKPIIQNKQPQANNNQQVHKNTQQTQQLSSLLLPFNLNTIQSYLVTNKLFKSQFTLYLRISPSYKHQTVTKKIKHQTGDQQIQTLSRKQLQKILQRFVLTIVDSNIKQGKQKQTNLQTTNHNDQQLIKVCQLQVLMK